VLPVLVGIRENLTMLIYATEAVAIFLFFYLLAALIRPEWF